MSESLLVYTAAYDGQHDQLDLLCSSCERVGVTLHCWPARTLASYFPPTVGNDYPNAGCYIGYRQALIDTLLMVKARTPGENDQEGWLNALATGMGGVKIDHYSHLFQCMNSPVLNWAPCVMHWNGKSSGREEFWKELTK